MINEIVRRIIQEATVTSVTAGIYNGPIGIGLKKWKKSSLIV